MMTVDDTSVVNSAIVKDSTRLDALFKAGAVCDPKAGVTG